jgi:GPH family glycoside/pentoside/hexuronide:cation symporter
VTQVSDRTLPLKVCFGWGLGSLGVGTLFNLTNVLALAFMTDVMGIAAAVGGLLLAGLKLYDIFADVAVGWLSDRTRSPWGRRRPYLLYGGVMLAISTFLIFGFGEIGDPAMGAAYMAGALLFYFTAYSTFNVPYMAMPAEMTESYHERSYLMSFRVAAISTANVVGSALGTFLVGAFGGGAAGHRGMAICVGAIVLAASFLCFRLTSGAPFTERHAPGGHSVREQFRMALQNRPFFVLMLVKFFGLIYFGFLATFPYMFTRVLKVPFSWLSVYFLVNSLTIIGVQPLWLGLGRRFSKKSLFAASLLGNAAIYLTWLVAQPGDPVWTVILRAAAQGIFGGGSLLMGQALLPDAIEYDRRRTGLRREGIFAGLYTTVEKAAGALGTGISGLFLGAMGYVQSRGGAVEQPPSAITAIYISTAVFPAILSLLGASMLLAWYDLTPEKLKAATPPVASR